MIYVIDEYKRINLNHLVWMEENGKGLIYFQMSNGLEAQKQFESRSLATAEADRLAAIIGLDAGV